MLRLLQLFFCIRKGDSKLQPLIHQAPANSRPLFLDMVSVRPENKTTLTVNPSKITWHVGCGGSLTLQDLLSFFSPMLPVRPSSLFKTQAKNHCWPGLLDWLNK